MSSHSACMEIDRGFIQDYDERRRAQNREAQRKYRQRLKANPATNHTRQQSPQQQVRSSKKKTSPNVSQPATSASIPITAPPNLKSPSYTGETESWNSGFSPPDFTFQASIDHLYAESQSISTSIHTPSTDSKLNTTLLPHSHENSTWLLTDENLSHDERSSTGGESSATGHVLGNAGGTFVPPSPQNSDWSQNGGMIERRSSTLTMPSFPEGSKRRSSLISSVPFESSNQDSYLYYTPRSECELIATDDLRRSSLPHLVQYHGAENYIDFKANNNQKPMASSPRPKVGALGSMDSSLLEKQLNSFRTRALRTTDRLLELYDLGLCLEFYSHDESLKSLLDLVHERFASLIITKYDNGINPTYSSNSDVSTGAPSVPRSPKRRKFTNL